MKPDDIHQLLLHQIKDTLGSEPDLTPSLQTLLEHVSQTYTKYDTELLRIQGDVKLRTDQLMASTSRAYAFLDSLNMGFIMCDISAEIVLTNQVVRRILSHKMSADSEPSNLPPSNTEWTLAAVDALLKPEVELKRLILQSLATSLPLECKAVNYGKHVLHIFIAPMINELSNGEKQQIGAVILVEDITAQKVLERSKDEFLLMASHELRTPLTAIRGNASLIKKYYGDRLPDKDTIEMIDDIHESAIRLIDIVNDFLDASALEQGKMQMNPEPFSIQEIVTSVVRELHTLAESKDITLVADPSIAALPEVTADRQRIKQVIYNLIGNAVKFTARGSITIRGRASDDFVYITVADTGKGMSAENQRLLFRKFQTAGTSLLTRDNTKGTGLGLYISKLIVEQSGGSIALERSELGKGSSFVFSLPCQKPKQPA